MKIAIRNSQIGNRKKHTPIPGLARHIAEFTNGASKHQLAAMRAEVADRLYAISEPITRPQRSTLNPQLPR